MNILLFGPAVAYIFLLGAGLATASVHGVQAIGVQVGLPPALSLTWHTEAVIGSSRHAFPDCGLESIRFACI